MGSLGCVLILDNKGDWDKGNKDRGANIWGHSKKVAIYEPRREASGETKPTSILILDFQPSELWENKYLLFKPHSLWYFVMAALAN